MRRLDGAPDDARLAPVAPEQFANLYERRLHPFCALFRNTPLFRRVAEHIGFHCHQSLWAEREEYLDTNELMSRVMRAAGYRYLRSSVLVGHFFAVSYDMAGEKHLRHHAMRRDALLADLRTNTAPREASRS